MEDLLESFSCDHAIAVLQSVPAFLLAATSVGPRASGEVGSGARLVFPALDVLKKTRRRVAARPVAFLKVNAKTSQDRVFPELVDLSLDEYNRQHIQPTTSKRLGEFPVTHSVLCNLVGAC